MLTKRSTAIAKCLSRQARWVIGLSKQRVEYHKKLRGEKTYLSDDRERKLNDIGFTWQCRVR